MSDAIRLWMITDFSRYRTIHDAATHLLGLLESGVYAVTLRHSGELSSVDALRLHRVLTLCFPDRSVFFHHPDALTEDAHIPFSRVHELSAARAACPQCRFACSTHTVEEAEYALEAGAHMVTLSPIFTPLSKPADTRKTIEAVAADRVYMLGGMTVSRIQRLAERGIRNFAGISLFYSDTAVEDVRTLVNLPV